MFCKSLSYSGMCFRILALIVIAITILYTAFINIDYKVYIPCKETGVDYNGVNGDLHFRRRIAEELLEISTQIRENAQNIHLLGEYRPHIDGPAKRIPDSQSTSYICPVNGLQFDSERFPYQAPEMNTPLISNDPTALKKAPTAAITLKLNGIIGQLDLRYKYTSLDLKLNSSTEVGDKADTCSEIYLGRKHGFPYYQQGFNVSPSCPQFKRTRPISDLVTILICFKNSTHLEKTLSGLRAYDSNFTILIAAKKGEELDKFSSYFKHLKVISVSKNDFAMEGKVWNMLVSHIKTPYALIAKDLTHYTKHSYLERLVHALSTSSTVGVAAGAFRNLTGHWNQGCQQSEIKNYFLRITRGYIHSADDCMFCDHVSGPFVAKTVVLKRIPFNNELPSQMVFYEWFLELKDFGILIVTCPDIMFFTQGENDPSRVKWFSLAKKRQISRIFIAPDKQIMFTCKELSLSCDPWKWGHYYLLPTCCFEQIAEALRLLPLFPNTTGLKYELDSGSQLAAVKLQGYSPWDLDGDIQYNKKYYEIFKFQKNIKSSIGTNFSTFEDKSKKFKLNTPEVYIEMWGMDVLSSSQYLPEDLKEIPTIMEVQGVWVPGQANPGLYARNKYGPHHLKHALFYLFNGHGPLDAYTTAGSWSNCPKNHHACLNRYPADGSVHFVPHYFENLGLSWDSIEGGHDKQKWIMDNGNCEK